MRGKLFDTKIIQNKSTWKINLESSITLHNFEYNNFGI